MTSWGIAPSPFLPCDLDALRAQDRDWFEAFLAAKYAGLPFEDFKDEMDGREETDTFFAWGAAVKSTRR